MQPAIALLNVECGRNRGRRRRLSALEATHAHAHAHGGSNEPAHGRIARLQRQQRADICGRVRWILCSVRAVLIRSSPRLCCSSRSRSLAACPCSLARSLELCASDGRKI